MNGPGNFGVLPNEEGHLVSDALQLGGFPRLLWRTMQLCQYPEPPQYEGVPRQDGNAYLYNVTVTVRAPVYLLLGDIRLTVASHTYAHGCALAAYRALGMVCQRHQLRLAGTPAGMYPPGAGDTSLWQAHMHNLSNPAGLDYNPMIESLGNYTRALEDMNGVNMTFGTRVASLCEHLTHQMRARDQQIAGLHYTIQEQNNRIGDLEEQLHDVNLHAEDLQVELAQLQANPPAPPQDLPAQDDNSGMESAPGMQAAVAMEGDEESVNQGPPPRARAPCYGYLSDASTSEEEDPEMDPDTIVPVTP